MDHGRVGRPLVPLFVGALAGSLLGVRVPVALWGAAVLLAGSAAAGRRWRPALFLVGAAALGLLASWQEASAPGDVPERVALPQPLDLRGVVEGPPEPLRTGWRFPLALEAVRDGVWRPVTGRVEVLLTTGEEGRPVGPERLDALGLGPGSRVEVRAELRPPPSGGNPGLFSLRDRMARQGVAAEAYVPARRFVKLLEPGRGPAAAVEAWRAKLTVRLFQALPRERAGLAAALLLGDRRWVDEKVEERLRAGGLGHLLAVSGMHVGILAGLGGWLVGGRGASSRWGARIALSLWLGFLSLLTGGAPSARRAVVMALVVLWAPRGRVDPAQAVATAGMVLLAGDPLAARDLGFQLSFAATTGILLLGPRWAAVLGRKAGSFGRSLGYGLAAAAGVAPLTAWHLGEVALWGAPATLAATPLLAAALVGLLAVALLGPVTPGFLASGVDLTLRGMLAVAGAAACLPGARWAVARPPLGILLLVVGALIWAARPGPRLLPPGLARRRAVLVLAVTAVLAAWGSLTGPGLLSLTIMDVGQGDALVMETPGGRRLLVDGGGWPAFGREPPPDVGARVVVPFLRVLGMTRLDLVASTHADADHTLGLGAVLDALPVRLLVHNGWVQPGAPVDMLGPWRVDGGQLVREGPARGGPTSLPHLALKAGDRILLEPGVTVTVLHPPADLPVDREANDASLVLRVDWGGMRVLLLGDVEVPAQRELLNRWGEEGLRSDVVKLAHHGAASGTWLPFLEAVAPQVAVVSVGRGNRYGHPHPETLAALASLGVPLYRTDRDGAIRIELGQGWARLRALGR